jgi:hypothetical protein
LKVADRENLMTLYVHLFRCLITGAVLFFTATVLTIPPALAEDAICVVSEISSAKIKCGDIEIQFKADSEHDKAALAKITNGTVINKPSSAATMAAADLTVYHEQYGFLGVVLALVVGLLVAYAYTGLISSKIAPAQIANKLAVGLDGRWSNSKLQATAWLVLVVTAYSGTVLLRCLAHMPYDAVLHVTIQDNLLKLAGISLAAVGGAKIVTGAKAAAATAAQPLPDPRNAKAPNQPGFAAANGYKDLFNNDKGEHSPADTQMIIVSGLAMVWFLVQLLQFWWDMPLYGQGSLPNPEDIVTLALGASLGGYLMKKIGNQIGDG